MPFITRWLSLVPLRRKTATDGRPKKRPPGEAPALRSRSYRAVELRSRGSACEAARKLMGRRMLVEEAPPLPLKGCTTRCACYYEPRADRRRDEPRRRSDVGITSSFYVGPERRSGLDRRVGQHAPVEEGYYDYVRRRAPPSSHPK